jgi:RNA polymerase sigma-70 factor (sigma-E family)
LNTQTVRAEDEFDEFYRATASRTLRYAYGLTSDGAAAQDLTQEAYVRAWQRWNTLRGYDNAEAWLRRVVTSLVTDWWRRLAVRRRHLQTAGALPPVPAPDENGVLLAEALRRLPVQQRRVITLFYLLDLPVNQIAAELGITEGTVRSTLTRGRSALSVLLTDGRDKERRHA